MDLDVSDLDELEDWIEQTRATHSRMPRAGLGRPLVRSPSATHGLLAGIGQAQKYRINRHK
jgi:hypothetical protein